MPRGEPPCHPPRFAVEMSGRAESSALGRTGWVARRSRWPPSSLSCFLQQRGIFREEESRRSARDFLEDERTTSCCITATLPRYCCAILVAITPREQQGD
eukprot:scaffold256933_cov28-Tisochrysis_lutea.AAC.3